MGEYERVANEYFQKIMNQKEQEEEDDFSKDMSEKEKIYYKFLQKKRERQNFQP